MNNWFIKFINKTSYETSTLRFWLINLVYVVLYFALVGTYFLANRTLYSSISNDSQALNNFYINAFSVPAFVVFGVSVIALLLKLGFLERSIAKLKLGFQNVADNREQRTLKKLDKHQQQAYLKEKNRLEKLNANKQNLKTKYPFIFASLAWLIQCIAWIVIIYN
ncbi:hypothetical protein [Mycoplasma nasistruthionis]|uniref:DUF3899 domain-containing protein n=1 Tax=Mycoplasma nasistruthionis TaxID=353852 RepID=A0A5B7XUB9_9MOLU|nr:hypothetical protein [Mycoplasma nasistruthionis]QCZ36468.1 hypothetical protein FG904_00295 [Mycoplasma nasistruthionis]